MSKGLQVRMEFYDKFRKLVKILASTRGSDMTIQHIELLASLNMMLDLVLDHYTKPKE